MWLAAIMVAAICNAFMDIVENENFYSSIFRDRNPRKWYKRESWKYAKKIFGYKLDAWHIAKSLMIIFFVAAIILYKFLPWFRLDEGWIDIIKDFFLAGLIWNVTFNLFYNKIFK